MHFRRIGQERRANGGHTTRQCRHRVGIEIYAFEIGVHVYDPRQRGLPRAGSEGNLDMAASTAKDDTAKHASLKFDVKNPRFDREFKSEDDVLSYLIDNADIDELVTSIMSAGWIDFEPMIVEKKTGVVLEGNRRLAALRLLSQQSTRQRVKYKIPGDAAPPQLPEEIRVRWVSSRNEARAFIAFKHINGPHKWDALAKAKYAAEWLETGESIDRVSRQIGDTHNTVLRMVNGWRVLEQAKSVGFDIEDVTSKTGRFNFSHLYTALARPNTRSFLGLAEDVNALLKAKPVPKSNHNQLEELMGWLYGQAKTGRQHVIRSQNPDLNILVKILASKAALHTLRSTKDFALAGEKVEPPSIKFEEALQGAASLSEKALSLVGHFEPDKQASLMDMVKRLATTVRGLRDQMKEQAEGGDDL